MLAFAIGITEGGEAQTLYSGNDFAAAQAAAKKGGESGAYTEVQAFRNPFPTWRHVYREVNRHKINIRSKAAVSEETALIEQPEKPEESKAKPKNKLV